MLTPHQRVLSAFFSLLQFVKQRLYSSCSASPAGSQAVHDF